jgi:hypothetical protein
VSPTSHLLRIALAPLGFDREALTIAALIALIVAGLVVSVGAWVLLARERRAYEAAMADLDAAAVQQEMAGVPEHEHAAAGVVDAPVAETEAWVEPPVEPAAAETEAWVEPPVEPAAEAEAETVVEPGPAPEADATAVLPAIPPDGGADEAWAPDHEDQPAPSEEEGAGEDQPSTVTPTRPPRRRGRRR